jgi:MFS family permease
VLADRVDRRRLLIGLDLARAVVMVAMAAATLAGLGSWVLLALFLVTYTLAAPYRPALTAAMPLLAGERDLAAANALVGTVRQLMTFVGPLAAAGMVLAFESPAGGFVANGASFAVSAYLLAALPQLSRNEAAGPTCAAGRPQAWLRDMGEGWQEVTAHVGLLVITVLVFAMYVVRGAELVLHILLATDRLDLGASGVGLLAGAIGLGAVLALPFIDRVTDTQRPAAVLMLAVASSAVPTALIGSTARVVPVFAALVVVGFGLVVFEALSLVMFQRLARLDTLGRVFGILNSASNGGKLVGALLTPLLVSAFGLRFAFVAIGAAAAAAAVASVPWLRAMERSTHARRPRVGAAGGRTRQRCRRSLQHPPQHWNDWRQRSRTSRCPQAPWSSGRATRPTTCSWCSTASSSVLDGDRPINRMTAGDWFGEIGLLQRRPRTSTVVADTEAAVWRIPGDVFLLSLQEQAAPPAAMLDAVSDRLARSAGRQPTPRVSRDRGRWRGCRPRPCSDAWTGAGPRARTPPRWRWRPATRPSRRLRPPLPAWPAPGRAAPPRRWTPRPRPRGPRDHRRTRPRRRAPCRRRPAP